MMRYILIIEDHRATALAVEKMLKMELPQLEIFISNNETEAKDFVVKNSSSIFMVFVDLHLTETEKAGSLIDFIRKFKLRTIVLTASKSLDLRNTIVNKLNVVDFVIKDNVSNILYITQLARWIWGNIVHKREAIVVDTSNVHRRMAISILTLLGFKSDEATNGREAFETIQTNEKISLVMTDLEMPEMDGTELTSLLKRRIHRPLVIIGLTGNKDKTQVVKFLKYGANDYITKPFSKEEFINRIRKDMLALEQTADLKKRIEIILKQKSEIETLATTDTLTQLFNRLKFHQLLEKNILESSTNGTAFAFIIFDIDKFKNINDTYGHDIGDYVLKELPKVVKTKLRESDIFARWGGEEFVLLLPKTGIAGGVGIAEKVRRAVERYKFEHVGQVTISLGVTRFSKGDNEEKILKRADKLLYKAKNSGRNRVEYS
jgi:diguanylate cyclase (GGDEF)-like protein